MENLYQPTMELWWSLNCYCSIDPPCPPADEGGALEFFKKYHFSVIANIYNPFWRRKTKLKEIYKRIKIILPDGYDNENLMIVYRHHKKVILPDNRYILMPYRGVIVYDKSKIELKF